MKTNSLRIIGGLFVVALLIAACGNGLADEYGGENCLFDSIRFSGDDTVYVTFIGGEQPGNYRIDGDRVIITAAGGEALVFKKNGGNLEASALGETMVCSPL